MQRAVALPLTLLRIGQRTVYKTNPGQQSYGSLHSFTLVDGSSVHLRQDDIFHGGQMRKQIEAKVKNPDDVDKTLLRTMFER